MDPLIDWEAFKPIIQPIYDNQGLTGGRPNRDPIIMMKMLVLQAWYGLSDPDLECHGDDKLSFQRFPGFPENSPDYSTVEVQGAPRRDEP